MHEQYDSRLLLASASPRRLEMVQGLGFDPIVEPADIDESQCDHLPVPERVMALAERKARLAAEHTKSRCRWVLGADTLVALDDHVFGKPADAIEATAMLRAMAGREHLVATGLYLLDRSLSASVSNDIKAACTGATGTVNNVGGRGHAIVSQTLVRFAAMSERELTALIALEEWRGAAGAYRIQQYSGLFVEWLKGSYSGVVGLPIREFYVILCACSCPLPFGTIGTADPGCVT
jgi:septum formation protein